MRSRQKRSLDETADTSAAEILLPPLDNPAASLETALAALGELPPNTEHHAELGGIIIRVLQQSLELQRIVDASTVATTAALTEALGAADLHPPPQTPLPPVHMLLFERVAAASRRACTRYAEAMAAAHGAAGISGASSDGADSLGDFAMRHGPPSAREIAALAEEEEQQRRGGKADVEADAAASSSAAAAATSGFRDAYMALLADGAPEELDALRTEEPAMDETALRALLDALESGCASFGAVPRQLLAPSFVGGESWWEQRAAAGAGAAGKQPRQKLQQQQQARARAVAEADEWGGGSSDEEEEEEEATPPLLARIRKLRQAAVVAAATAKA